MSTGAGVWRRVLERLRVFSEIRSILPRAPGMAAVLAEFSRNLARDSDRRHIARCLEVVLGRALKRRVIVVSHAEYAGGSSVGASRDDGVWRMDRSAVAADLEEMRLEEESGARFRREFGLDEKVGEGRIAALVPILSASGSRVGTVVIGRRWLVPFSERQRLLTAAVVGMAALLLEQGRLREDLRVAEAQAEMVARLVKSRRQAIWTSRN